LSCCGTLEARNGVQQTAEEISRVVDVEHDWLIVQQRNSGLAARGDLLTRQWKRLYLGRPRAGEHTMDDRLLKRERVGEVGARVAQRGDAPLEQAETIGVRGHLA
jgi:hypothetical protein